jgi:hypothetical protein
VRVRPRSIVLGTIGVAAGIIAMGELREATQSTHHRVDPHSRAVVVLDAHSKGAEAGRSIEEMVEALLVTCRLEVGHSDLTGRIDHLGGTRYRATFVPAMDETNRRQLRGCLEDWTLDQLRVDVISISPD